MNFLFFKRIAITVLFLLYVSVASAQISEVNIGVNGLTCSQCSRSVELRIRKLSFVKDVQMNLEHTEGKIIFKQGAKIAVDKIAQAVVDAGFSLRYLKATAVFNNTSIATGKCITYQGDTYQFVRASANTINGTATLTFVGAQYQDKKELKKWSPLMKNTCSDASGTVYHVAM